MSRYAAAVLAVLMVVALLILGAWREIEPPATVGVWRASEGNEALLENVTNAVWEQRACCLGGVTELRWRNRDLFAGKKDNASYYTVNLRRGGFEANLNPLAKTDLPRHVLAMVTEGDLEAIAERTNGKLIHRIVQHAGPEHAATGTFVLGLIDDESKTEARGLAIAEGCCGRELRKGCGCTRWRR